jgi:hypothetical protein
MSQEAATNHEAGNHETAAHHAHLAYWHQVHAAEHAEHAVKLIFYTIVSEVIDYQRVAVLETA